MDSFVEILFKCVSLREIDAHYIMSIHLFRFVYKICLLFLKNFSAPVYDLR